MTHPVLSLHALVTTYVVLCAATAVGGERTIAPIAAPFAMPQLQRPAFPTGEHPITAYGARPDADNTRSFADAIAACAASGGGRVVVPRGRWNTGPIHLKSGVNLHLNDDAEIVFSDRFEDYLPPVFVRHAGVEIFNYSPLIYARDCENVAITGAGRLNGNADRWWDWQKKETRRPFEMPADTPLEDRVFGTVEAAIRPSFLALVNCRNVLLEGFTITSGPNWTVHPTYCENVVIRSLTIDTHGPNNDGIDVDSCRNVLIEECDFNTGDDCVVLKSGYNHDGWRVARPTENVVIRRCRARHGHGGLVIGSEMSGDVRNVLMQECEFDGTDHVIRIKSRLDRGGVVENVHVNGIKAMDLKRDVVLLTMGYTADRIAVAATKPPVFRGIHVSNVVATGAPLAVVIQGLQESPIRDCHFEAMHITAKNGMQLQQIENVAFRDTSVKVAKGPVLDAAQVRGLIIERSSLDTPSGPRLHLADGTSDVEVIQCGFGSHADAIARDPSVPQTAFTIR